ncbi:MAG: tetratricopeptide repeat protein [Thermoanaerobaculia bacterium]
MSPSTPALGPALVVAALLGGVAPAPGQPPSPPAGIQEEDLGEQERAADDVKDLERQAADAYAEGHLPEAIAAYRDLAAQLADPAEKLRIQITVAWLQYQQGDLAASGATLKGALYAQPQAQLRAELYNLEFVSMFQNAQRDAVLARQSDAARLLHEGVTAIQGDRLPAARQLLSDSLALVPNQPVALYNLAVVDQAESHLEQALAGFDRVLALERAQPGLVSKSIKAQALINQGVIYLQRQQWEDADASLSQAASLDPKDPTTWRNLGLARKKLGRAAESMQAFRTAHERDPGDVDVVHELAAGYLAAKNWIDAVALLVEATQRHPEVASLWSDLGLAQRGLGNVDGALGSFRKAMELDPDDRHGDAGVAAAFLAETLLASRGFAEAATAAAAVTRFRPDDATGWMLLGLARKEQGDLPAAQSSLERARALAPERADVAHDLGTVYVAERDWTRAEAAFRAAVALDPGFAAAAAALAQLEAQRAGAAPAPRGTRPPPPPSLGAHFTAVSYPALAVQGLLVQSVDAGSPAARAGLAKDDLVTQVDGRPVTSEAALIEYLQRHSLRDPVLFDLLRAGKPIRLRIKF